MTSHSCTLDGQCELNDFGTYPSLPLCQQQCHPSHLTGHEREVIFMTLSYDPEQVTNLAPSDMVEYIRREYGIVSPLDQVAGLYIALASDSYLDLYRAGQFDYLHSRLKKVPPRELDNLDFLILQVLAPTLELQAVNWQALRLSIHMSLTSMLSQMYDLNFDDEVHQRFILACVVYEILMTANHLYRLNQVPDSPMEAPDSVPPFLYEYWEYLRERYGM
jgi:hypothetical protein